MTAPPELRPAPRYLLAPVHYVPSGTGTAPACLPHDRPGASRRRKSTADPGLVNCRQCRDTDAWQEADLFAGLDAYRAGGAR